MVSFLSPILQQSTTGYTLSEDRGKTVHHFYKNHKTVYLDTLFDQREYEVVAAFRSQVYKGNTDAFQYYEYIGPLTEKRFQTYVKNVKKQSLYDTGITPEYGEQLLTLVTCAYHTEDGRFVVVARRKM